MATTKRRVNEALDEIEAAQSVPATLPAVIPVAPAPVALGTLTAASPGALVQGAAEIAAELAAVIDRQHLCTTIQGRKHVNVEGWTTLGVMLGCVAREVSTTEHDGVYVAVVELVRMSDGVCISRASAECGEESPWNKRARYARRSMAQTRATGKACRLAFSWIMSLAGYEVTPAEEMPPIEAEQDLAPPSHQPAPPEQESERITQSQHRQLEATIRDYGLDRERVKDWVHRAWHIEHFPDLHPVQFERLLTKLKKWRDEEAERLAYEMAAAADAQTDDCPF